MSSHTTTGGGNGESAAPESWRSRDLLHELHVERGWTAADVARVHDAEQRVVRERLKELGIYRGQTNPPKSGLARKLWEHGLEDGGVE